jgi:hypothetical protein
MSSIVLIDHNALIKKRRFIPRATKNLSPIRQKFALLNLKGNLDDSESARFSDYRRQSVFFGAAFPASNEQ